MLSLFKFLDFLSFLVSAFPKTKRTAQKKPVHLDLLFSLIFLVAGFLLFGGWWRLAVGFLAVGFFFTFAKGKTFLT
jgi:4-hydroxybenzoate polyprenyltransferase